MHKFFTVILLVIMHFGFSQSEEGIEGNSGKLRVNLDCNFCDNDFIRQQLDYVDYVRDQGTADIHIFFTRNSSGSGGYVYDISFFGKNDFEESFFKLVFETNKLDSKDEIRQTIVGNVSAGLVPFLYNRQPGYTVLASSTVKTEFDNLSTSESIDPWRNWVFEIYGSGDFEWESQQKEIEYEYGLEVDRVTANYRINQDFSYSTNKKTIQDTIIIKVTVSEYSGRIVKSISEYWSAGLFSTMESNSYRNIDLLNSTEAAIEFNVFPWSVLSVKQFTFNYRAGYLYQDYVVESIYGKERDFVPIHSLGTEVIFNKPWGSIDSELELSQFINNPERMRLEFEFDVNVRLLKGLSARISAEYSIVRDQINLAKGEASIEDIISRQREIATDFDAEFSVGLSYTFGSMYNSIVNQRL